MLRSTHERETRGNKIVEGHGGRGGGALVSALLCKSYHHINFTRAWSAPTKRVRIAPSFGRENELMK